MHSRIFQSSGNLTHNTQVFENIEFDIIIEDGVELYPLKSICDAVDYKSNISTATILIRDKHKRQISIFNQKANRNYDTWYVTEPGIYQFLSRTSAPKAEKFQV
jgi:prophage antirepressor-like protein